jgi:type II secretory ATPase GspE/PulE/Tfp pilus assembly ATPase PilB-like protein
MLEIDLGSLDSARPKADTKRTHVANWSIENVCKLILSDAEERGADQIRIEPEQVHGGGGHDAEVIPGDERFSILYRIDGAYRPAMDVPVRFRGAVSTRFKNWARVGLAKRSRPQTGVLMVRFRTGRTVKTTRYIFESLPGPYGELLALTRRGSRVDQ